MLLVTDMTYANPILHCPTLGSQTSLYAVGTRSNLGDLITTFLRHHAEAERAL